MDYPYRHELLRCCFSSIRPTASLDIELNDFTRRALRYFHVSCSACIAGVFLSLFDRTRVSSHQGNYQNFSEGVSVQFLSFH